MPHWPSDQAKETLLQNPAGSLPILPLSTTGSLSTNQQDTCALQQGDFPHPHSTHPSKAPICSVSLRGLVPAGLISQPGTAPTLYQAGYQQHPQQGGAAGEEGGSAGLTTSPSIGEATGMTGSQGGRRVSLPEAWGMRADLPTRTHTLGRERQVSRQLRGSLHALITRPTVHPPPSSSVPGEGPGKQGLHCFASCLAAAPLRKEPSVSALAVKG